MASSPSRRGEIGRSTSRILREYGRPVQSVTTVTATIVAMTVFFVGLFPAEAVVLS
jgi:hypothetical protein